jgi:DNA end-binding protein Ku
VPEWDDEGADDAPVTRAFWSGTITFGLVSIPVALYAANRPHGVSLRMVGPRGTPLQRRYFTQKDDRELSSDDIVRGYEVEKGKFVLVDDDELERLAPERTRDIDVRQFVDAGEVDPMYFERAYYLTPAGGSNKAYRLLAKVMEETGRAGIATFVLRAKEYLVAIIAENGILRAETLRFADELRSPADVGLPEPARAAAAQVKRIDAEIGKRMEQKIGKSEVVDHASARLLKLAQDKLRAGDSVVQLDDEDDEDREDRPSAGRPVIDLMEVLKQRMAGVGGDENATGASDDGDEEDAPAKPGSRSKPRSAAKSKPKSAAKSKPGSTAKSASKSKAGSASKSKPASKPKSRTRKAA